MDSHNGDEREQGGGDDTLPITEFAERDYEELRESYLEHISFEECEQVRKAGQLFRESDRATPADTIQLVSDELGEETERSEWLLRLYVTISTNLETFSARAGFVARRWYNGKTLDELVEEEDRSLSELEKDIRSFTGSFIEEKNIEDTNLDREILDSAFQPYEEFAYFPPRSLEMSFPPQVVGLVAEMSAGRSSLEVIEEAVPDLTEVGVHPPSIVFDQIDIGKLATPLTGIQPLIESMDTQPVVQKDLSGIIDVISEEYFTLNDRAISAITEAAEASTSDWNEQVFDSEFEELNDEEPVEDIGELDSETAGGDVEWEPYTKEGSKAVAHITNIDRETARGVYIHCWATARRAAESAVKRTGTRISDPHLAVIAAVGSTLMFLTGRVDSGAIFIFNAIVYLSNFGNSD